ncbi:MAG TPA: MSHA biogenesis protein MshE, partial [Massilia sp.]|nr:MSHA biogenesis protein MshE [Massilia sp.]
VLAQRLVRVICESCSTTYAPTPPERSWLRAELGDFAEQAQFFHGKGCSHCNGTGYRGRTGVYELLEMTRAVTDAANHPDPAHFLKVAQAEMAGETLRRHSVQLAVQGRTTIAEAMRISNQVDD